MPYKIFSTALFVILLSGLFSCQKVIHVNINNSAPRYVVEGNVTDQPGPYLVKITKSVNFDENNTFPGVDGATVYITDSTTNVTDTLREITSGIYQTNLLTGISGHTYLLNIKTNGLTFTSSSTLPQSIGIDSLYTEAGLFNQDKLRAAILFTDPVGKGNYYNMIEQVNDSVATDVFVVSDDLEDGHQIEATFNRTLDINHGDTVSVTLESIDYGVYEYYFTLAQTIRQNSATPANPQSNIVGGALGYFSAHTVKKKTIIVQ